MRFICKTSTQTRPDSNHRTLTRRDHGFTLLELTVVILILGILASFILPNYFKTVELSRTMEAIATIRRIQASLHRCYYMSQDDMTRCLDLDHLDIDNPNDDPRSHFDYSLDVLSATDYEIAAQRNELNGGDPLNQIIFRYQMDSTAPKDKRATGLYTAVYK